MTLEDGEEQPETAILFQKSSSKHLINLSEKQMKAFLPPFVKYDLAELCFIGNHRSRNEKIRHLKTFNFIETVAGMCSFVFTEE